MTKSNLDPSTVNSPVEEEQDLCNAALASGAYDAISEREWLLLCEKAHNKAREKTRRSKTPVA